MQQNRKITSPILRAGMLPSSLLTDQGVKARITPTEGERFDAARYVCALAYA